MFLSRLAVIAEGATEVGFVSSLLERALGVPLHTHGIHASAAGRTKLPSTYWKPCSKAVSNSLASLCANMGETLA